MIMKPAVAALLVAGLSLATFHAAAAAVDPEASVVDELVVTGKSPGPVWWTAVKGGKTAWILGEPTSLPRGFKWNERRLDDRLGHARLVLLPTIGAAGLTDLFGVLSIQSRLKGPAPLEQRVPLDLRARYVRAVAAVGREPAAYDRWNGVMAGLILIQDFRRKTGIDTMEGIQTVAKAAARHHVPVAYAAKYRLMPALKEGSREITPAIEWTCLRAAIEEVEGGRARAAAAAEGWAKGDTREALTALRGEVACFNAVPVGARLSARAMADQTAAIESAVDKGGPIIALTSLRTLVAEDGILERLRRDGFDIHAGVAD